MDDLAGCRAASPPPLPPPPTLPLPPDDLILEILLRLPPEPIHLLRASLVSKHWRRLVHDTGFLRRFRAFHRTPPVLGFLNNHPGPPLFVPTSGAFAVPSTMSQRSWWALDCRHGLALLDRMEYLEFLVWDPMTGDERSLPRPPPAFNGWYHYNGAVLRLAAGHNDFLVALVFTDDDRDYLTSAYVYSSETGVWGDVTSVATPHSRVEPNPAALVGNTLYWQLDSSCILEFDLDKHNLDVIEVPDDAFSDYETQILLMPAEDGGLGFAGVKDFILHLWARVANSDGVLGWTLRRTVDLEKFLVPEVMARSVFSLEPIAFAEDADVIFIYVDNSVYMLHLKSMQFEEVLEKGTYGTIYPYTSFYTTEKAVQCRIGHSAGGRSWRLRVGF